MASLGGVGVLHDESVHLARSIACVREAQTMFAFVSQLPGHAEPCGWEEARVIARDGAADVLPGEWNSNASHRRAALARVAEKRLTHTLMMRQALQISHRRAACRAPRLPCES